MTDIPDDIQATADKIFNGLAVFDWSQAKTSMARAILAERERCAQIAASYASNQDDDYLDPEYATGRNCTARFISEDILFLHSLSPVPQPETAAQSDDFDITGYRP